MSLPIHVAYQYGFTFIRIYPSQYMWHISIALCSKELVYPSQYMWHIGIALCSKEYTPPNTCGISVNIVVWKNVHNLSYYMCHVNVTCCIEEYIPSQYPFHISVAYCLKWYKPMQSPCHIKIYGDTCINNSSWVQVLYSILVITMTS